MITKMYAIEHVEKFERLSQCSMQTTNNYLGTNKDDEMTLSEILQYFQWTNSSSCSLAHDFGGRIVGVTIAGIDNSTFRGLDGQKAVCLHPFQLAPPFQRCIVYSFGINDEWSFDETMEEYGCTVFSFDPSMNVSNHNRTNNIHFFRWGLGSESSDEWRNYTETPTKSLIQIYRDLAEWHGDDVDIDYLKIDIEWAEWHVLPQIIQSGMMEKVRQLAVEIHLPFIPPYFEEGQGLDQFRRLFKILRSVENYGMIRFDSKRNIFFQGKILSLNFTGPMAYEIAWYNSRFL